MARATAGDDRDLIFGDLLPRYDPLLFDEDEIVGSSANEAVERIVDAVAYRVDQLLAAARHGECYRRRAGEGSKF